MKNLYLCLSMLFFTATEAQVVYSQEWDAASVSRIDLDVTYHAQLEVRAVAGRTTIQFTSRTAGEYDSAFLPIYDLSNERLTLAFTPDPTFTFLDDKLAAHKVVAMNAVLEVPEGAQVVISGDACNVRIDGRFKHVDGYLGSGNFELVRFRESATLITHSGDITAQLPYADVHAQAPGGSVTGSVKLGVNPIVLKTQLGDIRLLQL